MQIKFTIDRFEEDKAVLISTDGTKMVWPKDKLPKDTHEGSVLNFEIISNLEKEQKDKQTAKDIINEILK